MLIDIMFFNEIFTYNNKRDIDISTDDEINNFIYITSLSDIQKLDKYI